MKPKAGSLKWLINLINPSQIDEGKNGKHTNYHYEELKREN